MSTSINEKERKGKGKKTHSEHRIKHVRMIRVLRFGRFGRRRWGDARKKGRGEIGRTEDTERRWGTRFELNE